MDPLYRRLARLNRRIVQARERLDIVHGLLLNRGSECDELVPAYARHCQTVRTLKAERQHLLMRLNARPREQDLVYQLTNGT